MSIHIASPVVKPNSFETIPSVLHLISKEQFGGTFSEDSSMHLHDSVDIFDMKMFKGVDSHIFNLKLFHSSLRVELNNDYCLTKW